MSISAQAHISKMIWRSAKLAFDIASKNGNFPPETRKEIEYQFLHTKDKDITVVAKMFRNRFEYFDATKMERKGTILSILRTVTNDDTQFLKLTKGATHEKVVQLYTIIREIDPMVQNLKYYRNHFAHTFKTNNQIGWASTIASSTIRLCEIAINTPEDYEKNQALIRDFKDHLHKIYSDVDKVSFENNSETKNEQKNQTDIYQAILDEILKSREAVIKKIQGLDELISIRKSEPIPIESGINSTDEEFEPEGESISETEIEISNVDNLSPEGLRQELDTIGAKIKRDCSQNPGFGASQNLLQIANIGAIMVHEPRNLQEFLRLPTVSSRVNLNADTIKLQIEQYETHINNLLSSVLWLSSLEN